MRLDPRTVGEAGRISPRRLNVASDRTNDRARASNTVASAQTGCLGWSVSEAGQRSERGGLGRLARDGVVRDRSADDTKPQEIHE